MEEGEEENGGQFSAGQQIVSQKKGEGEKKKHKSGSEKKAVFRAAENLVGEKKRKVKWNGSLLVLSHFTWAKKKIARSNKAACLTRKKEIYFYLFPFSIKKRIEMTASFDICFAK